MSKEQGAVVQSENAIYCIRQELLIDGTLALFNNRIEFTPEAENEEYAANVALSDVLEIGFVAGLSPGDAMTNVGYIQLLVHVPDPPYADARSSPHSNSSENGNTDHPKRKRDIQGATSTSASNISHAPLSKFSTRISAPLRWVSDATSHLRTFAWSPSTFGIGNKSPRERKPNSACVCRFQGNSMMKYRHSIGEGLPSTRLSRLSSRASFSDCQWDPSQTPNNENELGLESPIGNTESYFVVFQLPTREVAISFTTEALRISDQFKAMNTQDSDTSTHVVYTSNDWLANRVNAIEYPNRLQGRGILDGDLLMPEFDMPQEALPLLNRKTAPMLNLEIPPGLFVNRWQLAFCPSIHGISFQTFYRNVSGKGPCIFLIIDTNDQMFGAFVAEIQQRHTYYGSGETFVFKFRSTGYKNPRGLDVYRWSTLNKYFVFSDESTIAIGGGGQYALTINQDFDRGSSGACPTFNSPCLAASEDFLIKQIQIWTFQME